MRNLGISVDVNIPKPILTAAKEVPELDVNAERMTAILDASNVTVQTVAVLGVFGALIAILVYKKF
jgi:hypothetical protein